MNDEPHFSKVSLTEQLQRARAQIAPALAQLEACPGIAPAVICALRASLDWVDQAIATDEVNRARLGNGSSAVIEHTVAYKDPSGDAEAFATSIFRASKKCFALHGILNSLCRNLIADEDLSHDELTGAVMGALQLAGLAKDDIDAIEDRLIVRSSGAIAEAA